MTESQMKDSITFDQLGLNDQLLKALKLVGYERPSPIQAESIPPLLEGRDILGQAQTGTGKTAAFALPILQNIDARKKHPQALVLAPTRELAIQVAEAFQQYAHYMSGFHVLPIYGGQSYDNQIRALKRGVQIIVGTPGRVMDHMRKGTLKLDNLAHLVLDEADEMLRMGFIDDVEWVMSHVPETRQIALFSATMPRQIEKVAKTYLQDPVHVQIEVKTRTAETIEQRYWPVAGLHKLDALTRILEMETFDAMIIFVRTKTATVELAEKLEARGYKTEALNGDISQNVRERTVSRLKDGKIDILVATDVAARGLDVDRISHVVNYDIPYDTEAYVHRIGRTGRAGREGQAILFVARREMRMLKSIERATGKTIDPITLPSTKDINKKRVERFKQTILDALQNDNIQFYRAIIDELQKETDTGSLDIAAALAVIAQGDQPLLISDKTTKKPRKDDDFFDDSNRNNKKESRDSKSKERKPREKKAKDQNVDMETFRIDVGLKDGVTPSHIVGAIANEADIDSQYIGHIKLHEDYSTVDLPTGMPKEVKKILRKTWVCGKQLNIATVNSEENSQKKFSSDEGEQRKPRKRSQGKNENAPRSKSKDAPRKPRKRKPQ